MKYLSILILCMFLFSCSSNPSTGDTVANNEAIFVLIENGGTIPEEEQDDALNVSLNLLQQITTLSRRRATRDIQVHILLSALPIE